MLITLALPNFPASLEGENKKEAELFIHSLLSVSVFCWIVPLTVISFEILLSSIKEQLEPWVFAMLLYRILSSSDTLKNGCRANWVLEDKIGSQRRPIGENIENGDRKGGEAKYGDEGNKRLCGEIFDEVEVELSLFFVVGSTKKQLATLKFNFWHNKTFESIIRSLES